MPKEPIEIGYVGREGLVRYWVLRLCAIFFFGIGAWILFKGLTNTCGTNGTDGLAPAPAQQCLIIGGVFCVGALLLWFVVARFIRWLFTGRA
jgi:hypothetical protein